MTVGEMVGVGLDEPGANGEAANRSVAQTGVGVLLVGRLWSAGERRTTVRQTLVPHGAMRTMESMGVFQSPRTPGVGAASAEAEARTNQQARRRMNIGMPAANGEIVRDTG